MTNRKLYKFLTPKSKYQINVNHFEILHEIRSSLQNFKVPSIFLCKCELQMQKWPNLDVLFCFSYECVLHWVGS